MPNRRTEGQRDGQNCDSDNVRRAKDVQKWQSCIYHTTWDAAKRSHALLVMTHISCGY